jgi:hypothetical protein
MFSEIDNQKGLCHDINSIRKVVKLANEIQDKKEDSDE